MLSDAKVRNLEKAVRELVRPSNAKDLFKVDPVFFVPLDDDVPEIPAEHLAMTKEHRPGEKVRFTVSVLDEQDRIQAYLDYAERLKEAFERYQAHLQAPISLDRRRARE
jgi:hypothetical protein